MFEVLVKNDSHMLIRYTTSQREIKMKWVKYVK